jgi:hypothetical protein
MTVAKRLLRLLAICWLGLGCLALAGLGDVLDNQLVGWTLIVPAIPLGLVASPGCLYAVSDGWPVLTLIGVAVVYVAPGVLLLAVGWRRLRTTPATSTAGRS